MIADAYLIPDPVELLRIPLIMTVSELLSRAKQAIDSGENSLHAAAEDIAAAQAQGATQRQIAEAVGRSAAWVNRLLAWRQSGYPDTAFGPQAKASRTRAQRVQASEQKNQKPATTSEQAQAAAARASAETAKAEAAKAKADAQRAKAEAAKAKADARTAKAKEKASWYTSFQAAFGGNTEKKITSGPRERLVKALGMLGSNYDGERANAANVVEKQRAELGMTWEELIVPASDAKARAA